MHGIEKREEGVSIAVYFVIVGIILALIGAGIYITWAPEEEEEIVGEVYSLSISAESPKTAGQSSLITVSAYDAEGNPVSGAGISLTALAMDGGYPGDYKIELTLDDQGDGTYTSSLTSMWAGTYTIVAKAEGTDIRASDEATFVPGQVTQAIVTSASPEISFYFVDAYGNVVPVAEVEPSATTSFGQLGDVRTTPNDTFSVDLTLTDWGTAEITVTDNITGVSGSVEVEYPAVYLEITTTVTPPEIEVISYENLEIEVSEVDNQKISASISVSVPPTRGQLGTYYMTIQYDGSVLNFLGASDGDPNDYFLAPEVEEIDHNSIAIWQSGTQIAEITDVAVLDFQPIELVDNTPISVTDLYLYDLDDEPIPPPPENVTENGKTFKRVIVPMKFWIVENSGQTSADVSREAEEIENTFRKAAKDCRLKYWIIVITEINTIPKSVWDNAVGADNELSESEWRRLENYRNQPGVSVEGYRKWINVFLVPPCTLEDDSIGWWDPANDSIASDQSKDTHNRNLAHELVHEFSKSRVLDGPSTAGAEARRQGAREPNNIMRYCGGGDEISENQGKIINEELDRRVVGGLYNPRA